MLGQETACPLLELPRELRDLIFEYAILIAPETHGCFHKSYALSKPQPSLLAVSRQIRAEAADLFYGKGIFITDEPHAIISWLRCLEGGDRGKIRDVRFVRGAWERVRMGILKRPWEKVELTMGRREEGGKGELEVLRKVFRGKGFAEMEGVLSVV